MMAYDVLRLKFYVSTLTLNVEKGQATGYTLLLSTLLITYSQKISGKTLNLMTENCLQICSVFIVFSGSAIWPKYGGRFRKTQNILPRGNSAYERGGDAGPKFWIKPLKEADLGVAQAFFDP